MAADPGGAAQFAAPAQNLTKSPGTRKARVKGITVRFETMFLG